MNLVFLENNGIRFIRVYNHFIFRKEVICVINRILICSTNVFANDDNVLLHAKSCTGACLMQKKKSFENALNRIGLTIERLQVLFKRKFQKRENVSHILQVS